MRNVMIAALAAVAALAMSGTASAEVRGHVAIGWETTDFEFDSMFDGEGFYDYDFKYQGPNIEVNVIGPVADTGLFIMGDGRMQTQSTEYSYYYGSSEDFEEASGHAALFLGVRNENHGVAGFYAIQNWYGHSIQVVGVDVQKYFGVATVEASAAYGTHGGPAFDEYDAWTVQLGVTAYMGDNITFGGSIGYSAWDYNFGETDITSFEINGERRFENSPYSVRLAYIRGEAEDTFGDYSTDTIQVSFVIDLGSGNLRERNEEGASFSGADWFDTQARLWQGGSYVL